MSVNGATINHDYVENAFCVRRVDTEKNIVLTD